MISVIIPTSDEAEVLPATLAALAKAVTKLQAEVEVVVVDGASSDETTAIAERLGCRVVASPARDRAQQMNLGAEKSTGDLFLFLHADTHLPENGLGELHRQMALNPEIAGGCFRRRFDHPSIFLKATCYLADIRARLFALYFGDQAIFCRRDCFAKAGGFPLIAPFEDFAFSRQLSKLSKTCVLNATVVSSGRRFGRQPIRRTLQDFNLTAGYLLGKKSAQKSGKLLPSSHTKGP